MSAPEPVEPKWEHSISMQDAVALLEKAWPRLHALEAHITLCPFVYAPAARTEAVVIVARGKAARMLHRFVDEEIPPFDGDPDG